VVAPLSARGVPGSSLEASPSLIPFVKWPGGKSGELASIAALAPPLTGRLIDPFVGGGSVLLATPVGVPAWANDACADLVRVYRMVRDADAAVRDALGALAVAWDGLGVAEDWYRELGAAFRSGAEPTRGRSPMATGDLAIVVADAGPGLVEAWSRRLERDLPAKLDRMRRVQATVGAPLSDADLLANIEGAFRAAFYMAIRERYNGARLAGRWDAARTADFLFLREFAYAAMFRFNARDEFNVPYGGVTYNRKSFAEKISLMFSPAMTARVRATEWRSVDFAPFLASAEPDADDFVFVDPPYDSEFSAYDNRPFGWQEQRRLRDTLESLAARVLVVIRDTPMIRSLYGGGRWTITESAKTYMWTIKSRNDRRATHLVISNY
jgi:DNA adenine methylase